MHVACYCFFNWSQGNENVDTIHSATKYEKHVSILWSQQTQPKAIYSVVTRKGGPLLPCVCGLPIHR